MTSFNKTFAELAKLMLTKAKHPDASLADVTDAFKAMTFYNAQLLKHKGGETPDDGGFSFDIGLGETDGGISGRRSS